MKEVSELYAASMASLLRNRSYVKVRYENINIYAATDGHWTASDEADWSETETLDYERAYGPRIETLEHNRWVLDGSGQIMPTDFEVTYGYISAEMTG